jgi:hypothetical protein
LAAPPAKFEIAGHSSVALRYDLQSVSDGSILNTIDPDAHPAKSLNATPRLW